MSHSRYEDLVVGYVMDKDVAAAEHQELMPHLASCDACRDLFRELHSTAAELAFAAPPTAPAPDLEDRIIEQIRGTSATPLRRTQKLRGRIMLVAASVALLAISAVGVGMVSSVNDANAREQRAEAALTLIQDPRSVVARLTGDNQASGIVAVRPDGQGVLVLSGLPPAPEGFVHELWVMRDGVPIPVKVFDVIDAQVSTVVNFTEVSHEFDAAAVTIERGPNGSPKPTTDVILSGPMVTV